MDNDVDNESSTIQQDLARLAHELRITQILEGLSEEPWLGLGLVDTEGFPDVKQWIDLMALIADAVSRQPGVALEPETQPSQQPQPEQTGMTKPSVSEIKGKKRRRDKVDDIDNDEDPAKKRMRPKDNADDEEPASTRRILRPAKTISSKACKTGDCGRCVGYITKNKRETGGA